MTQNFERNLTQAMKEVLASIDPNYTFDKRRKTNERFSITRRY